MAKIIIKNETYKKIGVNEYGDEIGTIEIQMGSQTVITKARPDFLGRGHSVAGFVGRYVTSTKPWRASVSGEGNSLYVNFGRDDRSGRFNKANAISYDPAAYENLTNMKVWAAV